MASFHPIVYHTIRVAVPTVPSHIWLLAPGEVSEENWQPLFWLRYNFERHYTKCKREVDVGVPTEIKQSQHPKIIELLRPIDMPHRNIKMSGQAIAARAVTSMVLTFHLFNGQNTGSAPPPTCERNPWITSTFIMEVSVKLVETIVSRFGRFRIHVD